MGGLGHRQKFIVQFNSLFTLHQVQSMYKCGKNPWDQGSKDGLRKGRSPHTLVLQHATPNTGSLMLQMGSKAAGLGKTVHRNSLSQRGNSLTRTRN